MNEAKVADDAEAAAFADLYAAAPPQLADALGLQVRRVADATLLIAGAVPVPMFNRAIGLGLREPATAAALSAICDAYREAASKSWWLHWHPQAQPAGFESQLQSRGFAPPARRSWAKMWRGPEAAPEADTSLAVDEAARNEALPTAQAIAAAFEMPPFMPDWIAALSGRPRWRVYTAKAEGAIVGGGCLYVDGEVAWLGMGSILPTHRGLGGQRALMARRIADAIALGARHIVTETGEPIAGEPNPSLDNMRRCGFRKVASRLNYAAPPPVAAGHH
jgi:GNAT superfamily N-acetyltransferase